MARPGSAYPQVEPGAAALVGGAVARARLDVTAREGLDACRAIGARAVLLGSRHVVREQDLARMVAWDLGRVPARRLACNAPIVRARASEIDVRRRFIAGAALVVVREGRHLVGAVDRDSAGIAWPAASVAAQLEQPRSAEDDTRLWLLRVAGKVGEGTGARVFAAGGFVRDVLLGHRPLDVDLVVEGDGIAFARRLAEEIGGRVVAHASFGTASIEGAAAGRAPLGRVDVAAARRERYDRPGALPIVSPAGIAEDLARRDFSVNAMAVSLSPASFGRLLDPCGGRRDLTRRRLRPLHPLSFVEDPTRIFRAARYAARLGFSLDRDGRSALALALTVADVPALSGQRLRNEIDLIAAEDRARRALELLLTWKALSLWHGGYRAKAAAMRRVRDAARLRAWARRRGVAVEATALWLVALLVDQLPAVRRGSLDRLAVAGQPRATLDAAVGARQLAGRLERSVPRSQVADLLRPLPATVIAGAWLLGGGSTRRRIEWFLDRGTAIGARLSGHELMDLGVPRGPAVGRCLAALRRGRLDGRLRDDRAERLFVRQWLRGRHHRTTRGRKEA